ncbi:hypothetical protein AGLY_005427 [Aphis glycines]|uniref:Uncharacterized protein n=1 Tax=Aphis glycines TaxID=307491 RepID=A0A6G0TTY0_APHGL|nr:hypothetical protein AGLY_005427 [Aphis glycines]
MYIVDYYYAQGSCATDTTTSVRQIRGGGVLRLSARNSRNTFSLLLSQSQHQHHDVLCVLTMSRILRTSYAYLSFIPMTTALKIQPTRTPRKKITKPSCFSPRYEPANAVLTKCKSPSLNTLIRANNTYRECIKRNDLFSLIIIMLQILIEALERIQIFARSRKILTWRIRNKNECKTKIHQIYHALIIINS